MPPVSTTLAKLVAKVAVGIIDTGGKLATGVEYLRAFLKKFEAVLMGYSGDGGKLIIMTLSL